MIYLTSDTHFGHAAIVDYCQRPWADVQEMNAGLRKNWNSVIEPCDVVLHLGDFALGPSVLHPQYKAGLNGYSIITLGNHDATSTRMKAIGFNQAVKQLFFEIEGVRIWAAHVPYGQKDRFGRDLKRPGEKPVSCDIILCGHVHKEYRFDGVNLNVGVDVWSYYPVKLTDILDNFGHHVSMRSIERLEEQFKNATSGVV